MRQKSCFVRFSTITNLVRIVVGISVALVATSHAAAQYGGPGGTGGTGTSSSGGGYGSSTGKAVGIGVGAAAGAGLLIYALHHHAGMTGCVQPAEDGLRIVDEKNNVSYALVPGDVSVKAGQRVQLQGKKSKTDVGAQTFAAKKLVKDLGSCGNAAAGAQERSTGR